MDQQAAIGRILRHGRRLLPEAGLDTIVIGPGGMAQMHQPDEFITEEAMDEGLQFLERLLDEMSGRTA